LEQAGPSAGVLLRQAREAAGMDIAALAASLKVTIPKLQALEEDDYASLPDAVFARALASSICRTLKIDPAPVLERLPHGVMPRLLPEKPALNTTFRQPGERRMALPAVPRGAALAVLALLFGAAAVYFLPEGVLRWTMPARKAPPLPRRQQAVPCRCPLRRPMCKSSLTLPLRCPCPWLRLRTCLPLRRLKRLRPAALWALCLHQCSRPWRRCPLWWQPPALLLRCGIGGQQRAGGRVGVAVCGA